MGKDLQKEERKDSISTDELKQMKVLIKDQIFAFFTKFSALQDVYNNKKKLIEEKILLEQNQEIEKNLSFSDPIKTQEKIDLVEDGNVLSQVGLQDSNTLTDDTFLDSKEQSIEEPEVIVYYPPQEGYKNNKTTVRTSKPATADLYPSKNASPINVNVAAVPSPVHSKPFNKPAGKKFKSGEREPDLTGAPPKKGKFKTYSGTDRGQIFYDSEDISAIIRTRKSGAKKKSGFNISETKVIKHALIDKQILTIKELSERIGKTGIEIIKKLISLNIIKTINEPIDYDTAELVASELGVTLELQTNKTSEEIISAFHDVEEDSPENLVPRPPIVTIMGHVDHGKTSILDYIRKAHVASGEAGGITQHIGAYSVKINNDQISFIDTPGHAAFTSMRERGANVTDIVVIVVAADDGIMPQTIEAINHSKAAGVSIIVAINKIDKKSVDIDRLLTQLTEHGLIPEEWGGDIPCVRVSAKTGEGIDSLLKTILISAEVMELNANPNRKGRGTILEARLDVGKGPIATVIVQNGTLKVGDFIVAGTITGKIRAMQDEKGKSVNKVGPSHAVSILGLKDVPNAGDNLMAVDDERLTKHVADERIAIDKVNKIKSISVSLDDLYQGIEDGKLASVNLIIKGDVQGSVEALKSSLEQLTNDEVRVNVLQAIPGSINESDVTLAKTTDSVIIGFNVRPDAKARASAESKNVDIRLYRIIYDAIDDVQKAINGLLKPVFREEYLGKAEVRVVYKIPGLGEIAGSMVKDGKIVKNANVRLIRNDIVIADTMISSLKRVKDDAKEVNAGFECGIGLKDFHDFMVGDMIESFKLVQK